MQNLEDLENIAKYFFVNLEFEDYQDALKTAIHFESLLLLRAIHKHLLGTEESVWKEERAKVNEGFAFVLELAKKIAS